jgi:hypothetical protein
MGEAKDIAKIISAKEGGSNGTFDVHQTLPA